MNAHTEAGALTLGEMAAHDDPAIRQPAEALIELSTTALAILAHRLEQFGNRVSGAHREALMEIVGSYTLLAVGHRPGRYAFPLATGLGKTQSIVAWCAALARLGYENVSLLIAAHKVEALCAIKRDLIEAGVPESWVGLVHSYRHDPDKAGQDGYASEPATDDNEGRSILLVTHQRIKGGGGLTHYNVFNGRPRDLVIWDESLIVSQAWAVSLRALRAGAASLSILAEDDASARSLVDFLQSAAVLLEADFQRQQAGQAPGLIQLDAPDEPLRASYRAILRRHKASPELADFLDMADAPLRVVATEGGGIVRYQVTVPPELDRVAVLDASFPIRALEQADPTIIRALVGYDGIKQWDRVTMHQLRHGAGRATTARDIRLVADEVANLVRTLPEDEGVLIFTFKDRDGTRFRQTIEQALRGCGIDLAATVETDEGPRTRIAFRTWGEETSDSKHAYCSRVVFAGVLFRDAHDIAGHLVGQADDPSRPVASKEVRDVVQSEAAHGIYQAMSRGSCRFVDDGYARKMDAYLIHKDRNIRDLLAPVTPGMQWERWQGAHLGTDTLTEQGADVILTYLQELPASVTRVTIAQMRRDIANRFDRDGPIFRAARDLALKEAEWDLDGRSLVRR